MTPAFPNPFFPLAPCLCVRTRYRKRPPGVRDAFSEAFGAKNRLLGYGRDIRYRKRPPTVRNTHSVLKMASWGTRRIFRSIRCKKTGFSGTGEIFGTGNALLRYGMNRTRLLRSVFWLEDAAITNNPAHPNPINSPNHAKTHQLHKSHLLRKNSPTTSNSPNPQKPPCPIKAKRLTDSRRPTLRLCTKT